MSVTQLNDRIGFKSARFKLPLRNDSSDRLVEILLFDISSLFFSLIRMHQISSSDSECLWDQLISHIGKHLCEMHLCAICSCLQCGMKNEVLSKRRLRSPSLFHLFTFSYICLLLDPVLTYFCLLYDFCICRYFVWTKSKYGKISFMTWWWHYVRISHYDFHSPHLGSVLPCYPVCLVHLTRVKQRMKEALCFINTSHAPWASLVQ